MNGQDHDARTDGSPRFGQNYAQWVSAALALARNVDPRVISLFESSVPEPRALLREVVADLVQPDFKPLYVSAFAGGNPVAIEILAARYGVGSEQVTLRKAYTISGSALQAETADGSATVTADLSSTVNANIDSRDGVAVTLSYYALV